MSIYGHHHTISYSIASDNDETLPKKNFFTRQYVDRTNTNVECKQNKIPVFSPAVELEDNEEECVKLPASLEGHVVENGRSILCFGNSDSKTLTLLTTNHQGNGEIVTKKLKELNFNSYYDTILFSSDLRFCLLLDNYKDATYLHRKLHISYLMLQGNQQKPGHCQVTKNALVLKYNTSFALVKQHKYVISPNNLYLAVISLSNNQKRLDIVRIDRLQDESCIHLSLSKQIDLSSHFTFSYLQTLKFNNDGTKLLMVVTRTFKQNEVALYTASTNEVCNVNFNHSVRKNDTCFYFFVSDYYYSDVLTRISSSGHVEVLKVINDVHKTYRYIHVAHLGIAKQILSCDIVSFFKSTKIFLGTTGEIFVVDLHDGRCKARVTLADDRFKVSSIYVSWCQREIFALRDSHNKEKGKLKICYLSSTKALSLEEIASQAVMRVYPVQMLKKMRIPNTLRYLTV